MNKVDLHLHSTASDGLLTPEQVVSLSAAAGLKAIALTDHDSTQGVMPAKAAGEKLGITVISGLEVSTILGNEEVHILGYGLDTSHTGLQNTLALLRSARENRLQRIIFKLNQLGFALTWDDVLQQAGKTDSLGRPHVARAMAARGYATSQKDAFYRFLCPGGPAYVERFKIHPAAAIELIHAAGGLAFLAHPGLLRQGEAVAATLANAGLDGVEVYHTEHSLAIQQQFLTAARQLDLMISGGSDCHGETGRRLLGTVEVPWEHVAPWLKGLMG